MDLQPLRNDSDITQEWLEKMLSLKMNCKIKVDFWSVSQPPQREGFLSEIAFVKIQYTDTSEEEENECKLVFKFLPQDPKLVQFLANGELARREVQFYKFLNNPDFKEICEKIGMVPPVPEVYYAGYSESGITIVLRDLSVDNFKSVIIRDGSTISQTKTALRGMAVIHGAAFIYLQQNKAGGCLEGIFENYDTSFYEQFFVPNLKTLKEMYSGSSLSEVFNALIPLTKHIRSISKRHSILKTVVHGDLWAGQLLYSADESLVSIIDWQFCHLDNPIGDVMSMLFMSTNPRELEEHLDDIIGDYWSAFCRVVEAGGGNVEVTFEQVMDNVEEMWMYGFMFLAVSIHDFLGHDNISKKRLLGAFTFLEKRGVFARFLSELKNN